MPEVQLRDETEAELGPPEAKHADNEQSVGANAEDGEAWWNTLSQHVVSQGVEPAAIQLAGTSFGVHPDDHESDRKDTKPPQIPILPRRRGEKLDLTPSTNESTDSKPDGKKLPRIPIGPTAPHRQTLDLTPTRVTDDVNPTTTTDKGRDTTTSKGRGSLNLEEERLVSNAVQVVTQSFHWFADDAKDALNGLRKDLKTKDVPSWSEKIAAFVLETALLAGSQAVGLYLGARLAASPVVQEFLQNMFAPGIDVGVAAGRAVLSNKGNGDSAVDTFIDAQIVGVKDRGVAAQTAFIDSGQYKIENVEDATQLRRSVERPQMKKAAREQYATSRDAWVSYLAQLKYGSVSSTLGPLSGGGGLPPWVDPGEVTTNMQGDAGRASARQTDWDKMTVPEDGPSGGDALRGASPGVLTVIAELPSINRPFFRMEGSPSVELAMLNGVNAAIRGQYARPLSQSHIPRQIVARVSDAPDFTLNLDEKGRPAFKPASITWLASRAIVDDPRRVRFDDDTNHIHGMKLLLDDLTPSTISDKVTG